MTVIPPRHMAATNVGQLVNNAFVESALVHAQVSAARRGMNRRYRITLRRSHTSLVGERSDDDIGRVKCA